MPISHRILLGPAQATLSSLAGNPVDLVVTFPPYSMMEMGDESCAAQGESIADALKTGDADLYKSASEGKPISQPMRGKAWQFTVF